MSALSKATRKESDAYQAMTDASADVVARVLEGIAVTMRHWDYVEQGDRIIERRGLVRR